MSRSEFQAIGLSGLGVCVCGGGNINHLFNSRVMVDALIIKTITNLLIICFSFSVQ